MISFSKVSPQQVKTVQEMDDQQEKEFQDKLNAARWFLNDRGIHEIKPVITAEKDPFQSDGLEKS